MIAAGLAIALYPLTQIGERLETFGRYLAYLALALLLAGWVWLVYSLTRRGRMRRSDDPDPLS